VRSDVIRQQSAKELLALRPDVILTQNTPLTASMLQNGLDRGSHRRNQALMGGGTQRAYSRDRYRVGREKIDVIVGGGTISVLAAKQVIPIVLVSTGLVVNLARPSGNVAGLSSGAFARAFARPTETDCVAGHIRLELRNVVPNYPSESSRGFPGSQPNSGHGDY
jgi:hypothetical protein